MYKPEELPAPRRRAGELDDKPPYFRQFADLWADAKGVNTSEESVRKFASQYYGETSLLDAQIGRILKMLEKTGALDNTIIAFTSDHGDMLGDHWLIYKGAFHYDCLINTPLLISWPAALPKGRTVTALTEEVDIAATLLDLAGLPPPPGMQGVSLVPLGKGEKSSLKQATLTEASAPGGQSSNLQRFAVTVKTLRTEEWKLTFHQGHDYGELYDLKNDPNEFVNLWSNPACRARRDQLVAQLLDTLVRTEDPLPLRNYDY
jgi:arylsulfatase A-like enzyme